MADGSRYQGSGRAREGGLAAVHRKDFRVHVEGTDWRHTADQTDMNPALSALGGAFSAPTVQATLELMASQLGSGTGYVTIGSADGYSLGKYNVSSGTTTLKQAFDQAFADTALTNGGIVLVKAGTYRLTQTVTVPAGVTIMGEVAGTHIIGAMGEQSMFYVSESNDQFFQGNIGGAGVDHYASNTTDTSGFFNLILSDNIDGYSTSSGSAIATMQTVPMIQCERGSNVICDRVTFLGRISNGTTPATQISLRAIGYDSLTSSIYPTILKCHNCYFDGMANAIFFDAVNGAIDSLRIEKCRAKTGAASVGDAKLYSFVATNLVNMHFEGNYHVGDTSLGAKACFYITSTAVVDSDVRVMIVGNQGGLTTESSYELDNFLVNDNTNSFEGVNTGNSWGGAYNSWYVTVGDGTNSVGDITGTGAIDIALGRSVISTLDTDKRDTHVIVGYGTYSVTDTTLGSTASYVNLIGLDRNGNLPELQLNASTDTDAASNPTLMLGPNIQNIKFTAVGAYHTITPTYSPGSRDASSKIRNCRFVDVGVFYPAITRTTTDKISIELDTCTFKQTGTYADNFDFLITPAANQIMLKNIYRTGKGYVGGIGQVSGISYTPTVATESQITIDGCLFTLSDGAGTAVTNGITAASPLTGFNNFFFIYNTGAEVLISNSQMACTAEGHSNPTAVIGGGMPAAGTFTKFISLEAYRIDIESCYMTGPDQTYTDTAVNYTMRSVWIKTHKNLKVSNSYFRGGCFQVSHPYSGTSVSLLSSDFEAYTGNATTVVVDFDMNDDTLTDVVINGCNITGSAGATNYIAQHAYATGSYGALGTLQVYGQSSNVRLINSRINGTMAAGLPSGILALGAVYLDVYGDGLAILDDANVIANGNEIYFNNDMNTGSASNLSFALYAFGRKVSIHDNTVRYVTATSGGTNARGYASFSTDGYGDITGNIFERSGDLNSAAIVFAGTGAGMFADNVFTDPYLTGTTSSLILDASTGYGWVAERNINQTAEIAIMPFNGAHSINGKGVGYTEDIHFLEPNYGSGNMLFHATAAATTRECDIDIDLSSVIPPNAYVLNATSIATFAGAYTSPASIAQLYFRNETSNHAGTAITASGSFSVAASNPFDFRINYNQRPRLRLRVDIGDTGAGTAVITIEPIRVIYRW